MKKNIAIVIGIIMLSCLLVIIANSSKKIMFSIFEPEVMTACEITNKKGKVIFKCVGEKGTCDASALGYNLQCSGTEVKIED